MTNLGEVAKFLAVTTEVKGYIDFDKGKGVLKLDQKPQSNLQTLGPGACRNPSLGAPTPPGVCEITFREWADRANDVKYLESFQGAMSIYPLLTSCSMELFYRIAAVDS